MKPQLVEREAMVVPAQPLEEAIALPSVMLKLDAAGTLTGRFQQGKGQVMGEKGKPDFDALTTWLKGLPDEVLVSIQMAGAAPKEHLIGVINVLNKVGIEKVRFTDILGNE
ncbi:hypothetical protein N9A94_05980 [Akkermansiaceae bacterium]|nr:hypothetical protein [Akkermansiaceae bacterium]